MRKRFVRKRRTGRLTLKVVQNVTLSTSGGSHTNVSIAPQFAQFDELQPFVDVFEAYRFHWVKVKCTPYSNVSSFDSAIGPYVSASYKKPFDTTKCTPEALLSLDNSRQYHGNATSVRSFVPAVHVEAGASNGTTTSVIRWRPRIEIKDAGSTLVPHYCGVYAFPQATEDETTKELASYQYWFRIECLVTLYNQKLTF